MKTITSVAAIVSGGFLLAACAGTGLEEAKTHPAPANEFSKSLYEGYLKLSESEYEEYDFVDSDVFAEKASMASEGGEISPQEIGDRDLPEDRIPVMSASRERLMAAMAAGAATKSPKNAASAQVMFDCWMQEQEENIQPDDILACEKGFGDAMAKVDTDMAEPKSVAAAPPPAPEPTPESRSWVFYFGFDSAKLSDEDSDKINEIISYAKGDNAKVSLVGHTDRAGPDVYNDMLASERTEAVAKAMGEKGLYAGEVDLDSVGEKDPAVVTVDDKPEPLNRRVVVKVLNN